MWCFVHWMPVSPPCVSWNHCVLELRDPLLVLGLLPIIGAYAGPHCLLEEPHTLICKTNILPPPICRPTWQRLTQLHHSSLNNDHYFISPALTEFGEKGFSFSASLPLQHATCNNLQQLLKRTDLVNFRVFKWLISRQERATAGVWFRLTSLWFALCSGFFCVCMFLCCLSLFASSSKISIKTPY